MGHRLKDRGANYYCGGCNGDSCSSSDSGNVAVLVTRLVSVVVLTSVVMAVVVVALVLGSGGGNGGGDYSCG